MAAEAKDSGVAAEVVPLNVDKSPQDIEDIPAFLAQDFKVSEISERMTERLARNPKTPAVATVRPTEASRVATRRWKRASEFSRDRETHHGALMERNFDNVKRTTLTERHALEESKRCLKCADAPCTKSCPTSIDIKTFIQCIMTKNYYGAAKTILNNNPVGLTCGSVCPASELCVGGCNMSYEHPININGLQEFACAEFMKWGVKQITTADTSRDPAAFAQPIAIIGAGPTGLSCANYLGRLGYTSITVFEKSQYVGGLSASEIPQFRCHWDGVRWEARLCADLGVQFKYGQELGSPDLPNLQALYDQGYKAVYAGVGVDQSNRAACFDGLGPEQGVWTSKEFLPRVSGGSKKLEGKRVTLPKLSGQVLVLGCGDTAFDCIGSAFRVGAKRVSCVFRKSFSDMRTVCEERDLEIREFTDFMPLCEPVRVKLTDDGKICGVEFKMYNTEDDDVPELGVGKYSVAMKEGTTEENRFTLGCTAVIVAFGCALSEKQATGLAPLEVEKGLVKINDLQQSTTVPWAFAGGDIAGATMTVEAANDGKMAAWGIHTYLQPAICNPEVPMLPLFQSAIDNVDISITMAGVKFPNPFGLASAPCSTSAHMIRRAFEEGWGFAVTKTFTLDKHLVVNVSPRIVRSTNTPSMYGYQNGFINIELITEKTQSYWMKSMRELKDDFPNNVIVASVMAPLDKEAWQELTRVSVKSGADIVELNMSCPHGMHESGMGLECGQVPDSVKKIVEWCVEVAEGRPIFVKLTPNITEIGVIALAAKQGGALGVTVINTVSGIMDLDPAGEPWPKVGPKKQVVPGGMCGDQNRPITSRAVWSVRKYCGPDFAIMGTGGVSSAESTIQLTRLGASVMQICSAIQNQDYTIVKDYELGLKAYLYRLGRGDFNAPKGGMNFQNSWPAGAEWLKEVPGVHDADPKYGDFERIGIKQRRVDLIASESISDKCCANMDDIAPRDAPVTPVPLIDLVGSSFQNVVDHMDLSRSEQVVAVIVEDLCVQCGRCYMTCADNAYQAIIFTEDHKARVVPEDCTGCGLCQSVCPVPGCIQYTPMDRPFHPHRGISVKEDPWETKGQYL